MIKRVLMSCINYDHPQNGMLHAFQSLLGSSNVADFDFYDLLRKGMSKESISAAYVKACIDHKPDWVWMQLQDSKIITADDILKARVALPKTVFTHWTGDLRASVSPYLSSICKATHLTLISSTGQIPAFKAAGASRVKYCQVALDWNEDVLGSQYYEQPFRVPEVLFCGNYYGTTYPGTVDRERAVLALIKAKVDIGIVGHGWNSNYPVLGYCKLKEQVHVCKRSKICLNVNHFNDVERYYSDRQLVSMASGRPLVCKYIPGLEEEFTDGVHLRWYKTEDELALIVQQLLKDEQAREFIGSSGRSEVLKNHTWFNRFTGLIVDIEKIQRTL